MQLGSITWLDAVPWLRRAYPYLAVILLILGILSTINLILYIETARIKTVTGMAIRILIVALMWAFGIHFLLITWGSSII